MFVMFFVCLFPALTVGQSLPETYPPEIDRGSYYLEFASADSTDYPDAPREEPSVSAADLEFLQAPGENEDIGGVWRVTLTNGDIAHIDPKTYVSTPYIDFTLVAYYADYELLLFETRETEYRRYAIFSRESGEVALAFGPPVFSPPGSWFVTMGEDTLSGWAPIGLQLFKVHEDSFTQIIHFRTNQTTHKIGLSARKVERGGPTRCRWVDEGTFRLEMVKTSGPGEADRYSHYEVDIRKTPYHLDRSRKNGSN